MVSAVRIACACGHFHFHMLCLSYLWNLLNAWGKIGISHTTDSTCLAITLASMLRCDFCRIFARACAVHIVFGVCGVVTDIIILYISIVCMFQFDTRDNVDDTWDNVDKAWDNVDTCGCKRILELQRMLNLQAHGQSCYEPSSQLICNTGALLASEGRQSSGMDARRLCR